MIEEKKEKYSSLKDIREKNTFDLFMIFMKDRSFSFGKQTDTHILFIGTLSARISELTR